MTLNVICLAVAAVASAAALVLMNRRGTLPRPVAALFALNLAAIVMALVLTAVQASSP